MHRPTSMPLPVARGRTPPRKPKSNLRRFSPGHFPKDDRSPPSASRCANLARHASQPIPPNASRTFSTPLTLGRLFRSSRFVLLCSSGTSQKKFLVSPSPSATATRCQACHKPAPEEAILTLAPAARQKDNSISPRGFAVIIHLIHCLDVATQDYRRRSEHRSPAGKWAAPGDLQSTRRTPLRTGRLFQGASRGPRLKTGLTDAQIPPDAIVLKQLLY